MNDTFMKERPVLPLLLSMALPNVISMLVNSLYNIVDSLFVAQISEDAMTALSLVYPIQNFANAIAIGFGIGINAMIALYLGAGDRKKAEIAATHGMVLSLLHGVVITVVSMPAYPTCGYGPSLIMCRSSTMLWTRHGSPQVLKTPSLWI